MASKVIPQSVKQIIMGTKDDKISQLANDTKTVDGESRITSDYGVKQTNTDDWLRVTNDGQIGPSLLEDPFGREKVSWSHLQSTFLPL